LALKRRSGNGRLRRNPASHSDFEVGSAERTQTLRRVPQPDSCSATNQLLTHRIGAGEQRKGHSEAERFGVPHFLATQYLRTKGIKPQFPNFVSSVPIG
jgi:hypothetical protein